MAMRLIRVFLTGGTGSFGKSFIKLLLSQANISEVRVYSRDEHKQLALRDECSDERLTFFVGDVRDERRLTETMAGCQWVVHAAALKQAPLGEVEAGEFIKTNIEGSRNVIKASLANKVEKTLLISTDKAVEPINLYGATKMCAERLFLEANNLPANKHNGAFSFTRYGNVAGSRSTIVPIFLSLPPDAPTPITEEDATRFWITLPQANQFVLDSLVTMRGGESFFPRIPSVRVVDVAKALRPGKPTKIIGHRKGDKLHEVLTVDGERYCSSDNRFLTIDEIRDDCRDMSKNRLPHEVA